MATTTKETEHLYGNELNQGTKSAHCNNKICVQANFQSVTVKTAFGVLMAQYKL